MIYTWCTKVEVYGTLKCLKFPKQEWQGSLKGRKAGAFVKITQQRPYREGKSRELRHHAAEGSHPPPRELRDRGGAAGVPTQDPSRGRGRSRGQGAGPGWPRRGGQGGRLRVSGGLPPGRTGPRDRSRATWDSEDEDGRDGDSIGEGRARPGPRGLAPGLGRHRGL